MSKVEHARPRHILVRLDAAAPLGRRALQDELRRTARRAGWGDDALQLVRLGWPHATVRMEHDLAPAARKALAGIDGCGDGAGRTALRVVPLRTSGTLAALARADGRVPVRADRDGPARTGSPAQPPAR